jgi:hypothetical protein
MQDLVTLYRKHADILRAQENRLAQVGLGLADAADVLRRMRERYEQGLERPTPEADKEGIGHGQAQATLH